MTVFLRSEGTSARIERRVVSVGKRAVYVALGLYKEVGFFLKSGKPLPSAPAGYRHWRVEDASLDDLSRR